MFADHSTPHCLYLFSHGVEAKFNRLAASINVVVYNGEKDVCKSIQDLEFYDNGSMMLQVLLSNPDAIFEVILFC
jgi:hypothetical protein